MTLPTRAPSSRRPPRTSRKPDTPQTGSFVNRLSATSKSWAKLFVALREPTQPPRRAYQTIDLSLASEIGWFTSMTISMIRNADGDRGYRRNDPSPPYPCTCAQGEGTAWRRLAISSPVIRMPDNFPNFPNFWGIGNAGKFAAGRPPTEGGQSRGQRRCALTPCPLFCP